METFQEKIIYFKFHKFIASGKEIGPGKISKTDVFSQPDLPISRNKKLMIILS